MPEPPPHLAPATPPTAPATPLGAGVVKRPTRLADGRDLIYFDDPDTTLGPDRALDTRSLDPRPATATMRQDILTGDWISVAAARQNRAFLPPAELDPLAPQTPTNPSEIPSHYDVAVFENRSPSFGPALSEATGDAPAASDPPRGLDDLAHLGLGRTRTSVGRCEVVCFSPARSGSFGTQTPTRARTVIEAWADRTAALSALPGVQQVFPFENRGEAIGVTLQHPHGQIYSYPYITARTTRLLDAIDRTAPDLFARILAFEQAGPRVLLRGEHWTAFVPFAARWPIEVHLLPHRHVPDFAALDDAERDELAPIYLRLLRGIDALYGDPTPYIAAWHQAPVHVGRDTVRLNLQITSPRRAADKLKFLAGSEAAMGAWIGDVPPETAADRLRSAIEGVQL
ncbi:MAG: galactose-1-phosphate uridylyltransferase [Microbacterium sp. 69-7]|uniref:galactose-1-phosphate uridylyltransferase n=1 Tax=unclassified Microbacterium TaxID=2609290 RepID=UPI0008695AFE|nr:MULTISPECIES: galactose-1-phosphate uridylyltransferase [unclassified Microbacterium]ODT25510.1 MAG: galactose-1-phosphate uridylyltransferase [Microbacterium sp. SCN 69-37]OJU46243.1 MAG: galactose-1-phosphate uridylyltransferase [Microbacterium sp. 69-7]